MSNREDTQRKTYSVIALDFYKAVTESVLRQNIVCLEFDHKLKGLDVKPASTGRILFTATGPVRADGPKSDTSHVLHSESVLLKSERRHRVGWIMFSHQYKIKKEK